LGLLALGGATALLASALHALGWRHGNSRQ